MNHNDIYQDDKPRILKKTFYDQKRCDSFELGIMNKIITYVNLRFFQIYSDYIDFRFV